MFTKVLAQQLRRVVHQRYRAHLSAFPEQADLGGRCQPYISCAEIDQFLNAGAGIVEHTQQDRIPTAFPGSKIGLSKDLGEIFPGQVTDQGLTVTADRNGQNLLTLQ